MVILEKENNENNKVSIKLERHRWPDEIAKEKRKKKIIVTVTASVIFSFFLGWQFNRLVSVNGTPSSSGNVAKFERIYNEVVKDWYFTRDMKDPETEIMDNAIKGMFEMNGDIHSTYMTKDEMLQLNQSINMDFVGIGIQYYSGEGANVVTRVFRDSPAEKAGVKAGDVLVKIDGESIETWKSDQIKEHIVGEEGTSVNLEFLRGSETLSMDIVRSRVTAVVWGEIIQDNIGYLEISSFGNKLAENTEMYLKDFKDSNVDRLIIDLRDNGGGYLQAIQEISKLFLDNKAVVYQEDFTDGKVVSYTTDNSVASQYPFENIVILINGDTASASEVMTLALSENLNVKTVGVTSYGKGTVQTQRSFGDQSSIKLTIAKWLSPSGKSIHEVGIVPDVEVKQADIFYAQFPQIDENENIPYDSVHGAVSYVQKGLSYLGYHQGRVDGYYDSATDAALASFANAVNVPYNKSINLELTKQVYSAVVRDWSMHKAERDVQLNKAIEVVKNGN